ncbi:MAG TPA: transposase [Anaerolineae bacterium]
MSSKAEKRRTDKPHQAGEGEKKRARKRGQYRQERKKKPYHPARYLSRNQQEVVQRLLDGDVTMISNASWAFMEPFLLFLHEVGFFELIGVDGKQFRRQMIEVSLLIMTYSAKVLLGIASINQVPGRLFRDRALLLLIGYSSDQLLSGFCQRGHQDKQKPMHKNVLADAVEKLTAEEVATILNGAVQRLAARGVFNQSQGHFALDSSDLETTEQYRGVGKKKVTVRKRLPNKQYIEYDEYIYGFKVVVIYEVQLRLIVAAQVAPINQHDTNFTLDLLNQALANVGQDVIKVLLMDRGFLDGETLWTIKQTYGVDFIVPSKDDMHVTTDARAFRQTKADGQYLFRAERAGQGKKLEGQVRLYGLKDLTSYDQYGDADHQTKINRKDFKPNPINAIVVQHWQGRTYRAGQEKVFLTSLPIDQPLAVLLVVAGDYYAIFDLEELLIILGCEPEICWRVDPPEVRHRYGLPDPVPV